MSKNVTRLYKQFIPEHYDVQISISDDKKSFTGSVTINGKKVGRPSQRMTLHQKGLKISDASIKKSDGTEIVVSRTVLQNKLDEVRMHSDADIFPGQYEVHMNFEGKITANMDGVYPCNFEVDGVKKQLIATQFESHHAREAFPCIDEPEAKATFSLALTHAKGEVALGNTTVISENSEGGRTTTKFDVTPVMSTYLAAFVVGDMKYLEAKSSRGVAIRTYSTPDQIEHSKFALEVAVKCMDFYEEYFDIPYPLAKCDFVALPDFASGAMENWGLITFREQALLCDEKHTSIGAKQWVALVVAHELTHQWFGNLVTMRWWTDLWLNEGFASWMEYLAVDHIFPEWQLWTQFNVDEQLSAQGLDALEHTHPIEVEVHHPDEIRSIFDAISYQKGASVIHMLHDFLGPELFKEGIRHYLKKHSYANTDTVDLWQALEDVSKKPVRKFMNAWTSKPGYPILDVSRKNDHLTITQSRYVTNPSSEARNDKTLWPVPLLAEGLEADQISKKSTNVVLTGETPVKINMGQTGFYKVNYSHDIQQLQLKALDAGELSDTDRMGLLYDSFETTKAGYQTVSEYLDLLSHYRDEESLTVWEVIASSIGSIRNTLSKDDTDDELRDIMKPFVRKLVAPQLERIGWDKKSGEDHLDTLLRPMIIGLAAGAETESVVDRCIELYRDKMDNDVDVDPDLRATIYSVAVKVGGQKEFDELLTVYKDSTSSNEKLAITAAVTSFEQKEIHSKVLDLIKADVIKLQDVSYWVAYSMMNRHGRMITWEWLKENWEWLKENIGSDLSFFRMPIYAARCFADEKLLKDYKEFFGSVLEPSIERTYNQGIEVIETSTAWRTRDAQVALKWFKSN
ncbi:MAG: puromycin-sensitive aminopeptidase [Candidatus Saccharimonadales bacterium]|jgi:puromycin-sensitive aminopeptidase